MDTIIKNVMIYDGCGTSPFLSSIHISGERIKKISKNIVNQGNMIIDGSSLALCPGFIDIHSHSDLEIFRKNKLSYAINQGITTEIIGQDGLSLAPSNSDTVEDLYKYVQYYSGKIDERYIYQNFYDFNKYLHENINDTKVESLVGHGTIRMIIAGNENRKLLNHEMEKIKTIVRESLNGGAIGISFSLLEPPSSFADEEEIIEICKIIAEYDAIAMIYLRDDKNLLLESIDLVARIGEKSKARMHISQLKVIGYNNIGKMKLAVERIENYIAKGIDLSYDNYPYNAMYSPLSILLTLNVDAIKNEIDSKDLIAKILKNIDTNIEEYGGDENIMITTSKKNKEIIGKRIREIKEERGMSSAEIVLNLLEKENDIHGLFFSISNFDMELLLKHPLGCICTDGIVSDFPHPRVYGTFPRVLGYYVRKNRLMSLESAIKKMTGEPARRLRLWDRGIIREGMKADLVLFDPNKIRDNNTYLDSKKYPIGIKAVWVDGEMKSGDF